MGLTIWLCVLCLQASLLTLALDCPGAIQRARSVGGRIADGQYDDLMQKRSAPSTDTARRETLAMVRHKRRSERMDPTHLNPPSLPGAVSVKGSPLSLIQGDRTRRHLTQAAGKKKTLKRKSRIGSYSLIHNVRISVPIEVTRVRRHANTEPTKRGKSGRSGAYSILGDPDSELQSDRPKRSVQKKRAAKKNVC